MTDIFREVDEAVRQDKAQELWRRYGKLAVAGVVAVLLAAGGFSAWREYRIDQRRDAGDAFSAAERLLSEGKPDEAAAAFLAVAERDVAAYGELARMRAAQAMADAGRPDEAVGILDGLAADEGADDMLRAVARLSAVALLLDDGDPAALRERLAPILLDDSPVRASARELQGLVALKSGEVAEAAGIFRALADDPATVGGIRARAERILATLGTAGTAP